MTDKPRLLTRRWPNPCLHTWQMPWLKAEVLHCTRCGTYPHLPTYRRGVPRTYPDLSLWSGTRPRGI
jgi:hypothetical protein